MPSDGQGHSQIEEKRAGKNIIHPLHNVVRIHRCSLVGGQNLKTRYSTLFTIYYLLSNSMTSFYECMEEIADAQCLRLRPSTSGLYLKNAHQISYTLHFTLVRTSRLSTHAGTAIFNVNLTFDAPYRFNTEYFSCSSTQCG